MKKGLIILIIFFNSTLNFAQEFNFGLERGYNLSVFRYENIKFDNFKNIKPVYTGNTNIFLSYKTKSLIGYSLELGVIQKGAKINSKYKLYYIQMPTTFDFYFSKKVSLSLGSEFSYMFFGLNKRGFVNYQNISSVYKNDIEISGLAGINFKFDEILNISFRYSRSLTSSLKLQITDSESDGILETSQYNHYIQLLFRVNLSEVLKKKNKNI